LEDGSVDTKGFLTTLGILNCSSDVLLLLEATGEAEADLWVFWGGSSVLVSDLGFLLLLPAPVLPAKYKELLIFFVTIR